MPSTFNCSDTPGGQGDPGDPGRPVLGDLLFAVCDINFAAISARSAIRLHFGWFFVWRMFLGIRHIRHIRHIRQEVGANRRNGR